MYVCGGSEVGTVTGFIEAAKGTAGKMTVAPRVTLNQQARVEALKAADLVVQAERITNATGNVYFMWGVHGMAPDDETDWVMI